MKKTKKKEVVKYGFNIFNKKGTVAEPGTSTQELFNNYKKMLKKLKEFLSEKS